MLCHECCKDFAFNHILTVLSGKKMHWENITSLKCSLKYLLLFSAETSSTRLFCGHLCSLRSQFYCKDFKKNMKVFFINLSWGVGVSLHAFCRKKKQDKKNIHDVFYKLTAHKHKIFFPWLIASVSKIAWTILYKLFPVIRIKVLGSMVYIYCGFAHF